MKHIDDDDFWKNVNLIAKEVRNWPKEKYDHAMLAINNNGEIK